MRHGNVLNVEPVQAAQSMTSRRRKEQQQSKEKWLWIVLAIGLAGGVVLMSISF
jgi:hypothetical protein